MRNALTPYMVWIHCSMRLVYKIYEQIQVLKHPLIIYQIKVDHFIPDWNINFSTSTKFNGYLTWSSCIIHTIEFHKLISMYKVHRRKFPLTLAMYSYSNHKRRLRVREFYWLSLTSLYNEDDLNMCHRVYGLWKWFGGSYY